VSLGALWHGKATSEPTFFNCKMADKSTLLPLIVSQLQHYELNSVATVVAEAAMGAPAAYAPSNRLAEMVEAAGRVSSLARHPPPLDTAEPKQKPVDVKVPQEPEGLDAVDSQAPGIRAAEKPRLAVRFTVAHRAPCRAIVFNADGSLLIPSGVTAGRYGATGSTDGQVKVWSLDGQQSHGRDADPCLRTFLEYPDAVTDLAFHPNGRVLAASSEDAMVRFYDVQRYGARRPFRYVNVRFYPTDDGLI
jgi:cleavage stimulation factor subunit 1